MGFLASGGRNRTLVGIYTTKSWMVEYNSDYITILSRTRSLGVGLMQTTETDDPPGRSTLRSYYQRSKALMAIPRCENTREGLSKAPSGCSGE